MQRLTRSCVHTTLAALLFWSFSFVLATPVSAGEHESNARSLVGPRLQPVFSACGKKWVKRARTLSQDQLSWLLEAHHSIYDLELNRRLVLSMEVLSSASFRNCDIQNHWSDRATSIRLTYYLADGSEKVVLANFANDDVFFNGAPTFYPRIGKALLKGTTVEGKQANRWIQLEPLKVLYAAAAVEEPQTLVAATSAQP